MLWSGVSGHISTLDQVVVNHEFQTTLALYVASSLSPMDKTKSKCGRGGLKAVHGGHFRGMLASPESALAWFCDLTCLPKPRHLMSG